MTLASDRKPGEPLLQPVVRGGALVNPLPDLDAMRARLADGLERLPEALKSLVERARYRVDIDPALEALAREADESI